MAKRKASKRTYKGRRRSVAKPKRKPRKKTSPLNKKQLAHFTALVTGQEWTDDDSE